MTVVMQQPQFLGSDKQVKDTLKDLSLFDSVEGASYLTTLSAESELVLPANKPSSETVVTHDGETTGTG